MKPRSPFLRSLVLYGCITAAVIVSLVFWRMGESRDVAHPAPRLAAAVLPQPASDSPASPRLSMSPAGPTDVAKTFDTFQLRPFAVAKESGTHAWTAEDGRSPDAILEIAHNEMEVQRLMEENPRIKGRQLVYRKEPVFELVQRARAAGEPLKKLMLPGLNGLEVEVEVDRADLAASGLSGTLTGRVPGRGQSWVTLAFKEGREAFTVMSPDDGTFLQGHPRESGEIIVSTFDPETYLPTPGGEPIKTTK